MDTCAVLLHLYSVQTDAQQQAQCSVSRRGENKPLLLSKTNPEEATFPKPQSSWETVSGRDFAAALR